MRISSPLFLAISLNVFFAVDASRPPDAKLVLVSRSDLCITEGSIEELPGNRLSVRVPTMRAYLNQSTPQDVQARFTYLGSTGNEARLGSGELRRQFGLKLRAEDACNLVYAMWRIEPESKLVVSIKSNPGQHTSAECANRGYKNIKPAHSSPVPSLSEGQAHSLHAAMQGKDLKVYVDDRLVWQGQLGMEATGLQGPVGIRSDNARLELQLFAPLATNSQQHGGTAACHAGPQESE
ncbi:MAG: hypothetical protein WCE52_21960 [Candidatus Acidiferrum sp.]